MLLAVEVTVKQIHMNTNSLVLIWNDGQIRWRPWGELGEGYNRNFLPFWQCSVRLKQF